MPVHLVAEGSLFDQGAQTLVNPVNCVGVMGAGLAKAFAQRFPAHLAWYQDACREGLIRPGRPQLDRGQQPWILAFPSKDHWRQPSTPELIDAGLAAVARRLAGSGIESMAMPALGCGLGGLPFELVHDLTVKHLGAAPIPIWLFRPR